MTSMILHDEQGNILSVAKIGDLKAAGSKFTSVGMVPGAGQHLSEVQLSAADDQLPLSQLHTEFRFDSNSAQLVRKTA